jgi:phosphatidylglycerophosphate synthase
VKPAVSHDTLLHRIVRPAVRAVAPTSVTPNHITTLRLLTAVAAALAFATGSETWSTVGGWIFLLSMLLDRADGELARQTGSSSPAGHRYDVLSDCAANVLAVLGIGVGQAPVLGALGPLLGALAGAGIAVLFWQFTGLGLAQHRSYALWGGRVIVDPDDAAILVPVLVWCGAAALMLAVAAVATPLAALWLALRGSTGGGRADGPQG